MVDELRLGLIAGVIILISILAIGFSAIGHPFSTRDKEFSPSSDSLGNPSLASIGSSTDPEKQLENAYASSAAEEIERCLNGSSDKVASAPFCADNLLILKKSCQNPQTYINACENDKFLKYLERNSI